MCVLSSDFKKIQTKKYIIIFSFEMESALFVKMNKNNIIVIHIFTAFAQLCTRAIEVCHTYHYYSKIIILE